MTHIVSREPWATIDLNVAEGRVFVREDWRYIWVTARDQPHWTQEEQHAFHHFVDRSIWSHWSSRALIRVRPTSLMRSSPSGWLRQKLMEHPLAVTFDVRRVVTGEQWLVKVTKVDSKIDPKPQARVEFSEKEIFLYSTDLLIHRARRFNNDVPLEGFKVHPHEFGHTLKNFDDEYKKDSSYFEDRQSIMNIGQQLRVRHFGSLCQTLHRMVHGCEFVPFIGSHLGAQL